jgi:hypothetical protein
VAAAAAVATAGKLLSSIVMIGGPAQAGPFLWCLRCAARLGFAIAPFAIPHPGNANDKSVS